MQLHLPKKVFDSGSLRRRFWLVFVPGVLAVFALSLIIFADKVLAVIYHGNGFYTKVCGDYISPAGDLNGNVFRPDGACRQKCDLASGTCSGGAVFRFECDGKTTSCQSNKSGPSASQSLNRPGLCGKTAQIDVFRTNCLDRGNCNSLLSHDPNADLQDFVVWYSGDCAPVVPAPVCNDSSVSLSVSPGVANQDSPINFRIYGDASTFVNDNFGGGVNNCTGSWNSKTCVAVSPGNFIWTHSWRHCEGNFNNCSNICVKSANFSIVSPSPVYVSSPVYIPSPVYVSSPVYIPSPTYVSSPVLVSSPAADIKANGSDGPITIPYNASANLSWTSSNANSCAASNGWSGYKSVSGSESTGALTYNRTYTITCAGSGGSVSDSVTVNVDAQQIPTLYVFLETVPNYGVAPLNNVDLKATVSGTAQGTINYKFDCQNDGIWDYYYNNIWDNPKTIVDACNYSAAGAYTAKVQTERDAASPAQNTAIITVASPSYPVYISSPAADIKANGSDGPITIPYNASANLSWTSSNANSCAAGNAWSGSRYTSGSESTGALTYNRTYTITCAGSGGSVSDSVTVNVGTQGTISAQKLAANLSDGTGWMEQVPADPGEIISFSIQVSGAGSQLQNVIVRDILPAQMKYRGNLKIDNISSIGDIISGLDIGFLSPGQTKTISFEAEVLGKDNFTFGETKLTNSVAVSAAGAGAAVSDTAQVVVLKTAVAGAVTSISTGFTDNLFLDSFFLPLLFALTTLWLFKSHILKFEEWKDKRTKEYQKYRVEKTLGMEIAKIKFREFLQRRIM